MTGHTESGLPPKAERCGLCGCKVTNCLCEPRMPPTTHHGSHMWAYAGRYGWRKLWRHRFYCVRHCTPDHCKELWTWRKRPAWCSSCVTWRPGTEGTAYRGH